MHRLVMGDESPVEEMRLELLPKKNWKEEAEHTSSGKPVQTVDASWTKMFLRCMYRGIKWKKFQELFIWSTIMENFMEQSSCLKMQRYSKSDQWNLF